MPNPAKRRHSASSAGTARSSDRAAERPDLRRIRLRQGRDRRIVRERRGPGGNRARRLPRLADRISPSAPVEQVGLA